jgi:general secretion pathway protein G
METNAHGLPRSETRIPPEIETIGADRWSSRASAANSTPRGVSARTLWIVGITGFLALVGGASLMASVLPKLWREAARARQVKIVSDLRAIRVAVEHYSRRNGGRYPDRLDELVTPDARGETDLARGVLPIDPWKHPYRYDPPTSAHPVPRIYTLGKDQRPGGTGDDADVDDETMVLKAAAMKAGFTEKK